MNAKKIFVAAIALNFVLLAFAASLYHRWKSQCGGDGDNCTMMSVVSGPDGKFGPVMEIVLPAEINGRAQLVDLETGRALPQEGLEHFDFRADAVMAWIRSNGLDISCIVWSSGAVCITYDMTVVAVEGKCWEETTEQELLGNPALTPVRHAPRKLLVLGDNQPDTYMFRTGDGTLGMLRIAGLSQDKQGVKLRYKMINPAKSIPLPQSCEKMLPESKQ